MSVAVPRLFSSKIIFVYGSGSPLDWSVIVPDIFSDNKKDDRIRIEVIVFIREFREIKNTYF
jgi:hypothetical protein